jgi:ribosome-associated toxin RatA of RatAB toxin-antitoxin module
VTAEKDLVMVPQGRHAAAAGRQHAWRLFLCTVLIATLGAMPSADPMEGQRVEVTETGGVYQVTAAFAVTESPQTVIAVLTDYDRIPKFMPDVQVSRVIERTPTGVIVEQEAVSRFMLFSKRIHLLLDVQESGGSIRFRDRGGKSFASYYGGWTISQHDSLTVIDYQLSAKPTFEVPAFVLKRLLKRDSALLIDRMKAEISARENRAK